jgi:hypothetical protein
VISVVIRSRPRRERDASRLPAWRKDRHPESLQEPDAGRCARRTGDFAVHCSLGFKADLDLPGFLAQSELKPISIEKVSFPPIWSLVTCIKN